MVRKVFGFDTRVASLLEDIQFAWHPQRGQYHSTPILEALADRSPPEAVRVVALCRVDLFIPILTHVFGEAQLNGRACIISSCRLAGGLKGTDANRQFIARVTKEVIHELGHTFDLRHCPDPACPMHYCRGEEDVDRKSDRLCRYCRVLLGDAVKKL
jgi:archaemetzincin